MKIDEIKAAYVAGKAIPSKFAGKAIAKDAQMLFTYLMDNNPAAINIALRLKLGNKFLDVSPNRKQMGGLINSLIEKNDTQSLQTIINTFNEYGFNDKADNYTVDAELRKEILNNIN